MGISDANRWGYAYVYDLFVRRFPDVPEQARDIATDLAMERLLLRYLGNVGAQTELASKRLFGWNDWEWERLLERLSAGEKLQSGIRIEGIRGACLASADLMSADMAASDCPGQGEQ